MTENTAPEKTATTTKGAPSTVSLGTLEHIDPNVLDLGENVRDHVEDDPDLLASITEHGVLVPVTAVRRIDGTVTVREGQRRTLAARAGGLRTVPVYITEDTAADDKARTVERVTQQIITNDKRRALTEAQRAKGIQELLVAGLTPTKVSKALNVRKDLVEAAATAAASTSALDAMDHSQLTIEQAAALVEFENDPDAIAYLVQAQSPGEFEHRVAERRQHAATEAARAQAAKTYVERGYTILTQRPTWGAADSLLRLDFLCTPERATVDEEVPATNPQLWSVWLEEMPIFIDTRTGEEVAEDGVDWDVDAEDHDSPAEEGYIHPRFIEETVGFEPTYYCKDIDAAGLTTWSQRNQGRGVHDATGSGESAEQRKEAERREKRKVIALNKLGLAAEQVRRAWVKDKLLSRKTPPKGAAIFVATILSAHPTLLTGTRAPDVTRELLGLGERDSLDKTVRALPPTGDGRATVILLGQVLGALEAETPKDAWRGSYSTNSKDYLTFLAANGYELSDIEKVVTKTIKADKLYDKTVTATNDTEAVA